VDKTKVTCIKWLPNSINLFLVGYSSGNMYLYDASHLAQASAAPAFTKLCQNESFSLHINNNSSSMNISSTLPANTTNTTSTYQQKLFLSNSSQPAAPIAKNPVLKLTIGSCSNPFSSGSASNSNSQASAQNINEMFSNTNGSGNSVNEFAFSPCGTYLAVVSQDGYLRVFSFLYQNNQQMQIQLKCSMKSYFGGLLCACWSSDGRYIATGGEDDLITVFSFADMRVTCRGRGHSSWINCVAFDPWTRLNYSGSASSRKASAKPSKCCSASKPSANISSTRNDNGNKEDNESDLEEFHNKNQQKLTNLSLGHSSRNKNIMCSPKKRTISTLSDFMSGPSARKDSSRSAKAVYYRLASCGQDNQICFWDLTEDVLREKPVPHSSARTRVTSMLSNAQASVSPPALSANLPQIIIQPMSLAQEQQAAQQSQQQQQQARPHHHHHHSTASSIVSSAKSFFSSSSSSSSSNKHDGNGHDGSNGIGASFFKKHKRNASNNSTSSSNLTDKTKQKSSGNQVTLNSYKPMSSISSTNTLTNSNEYYSTDSGVNSIASKKTSATNKNPSNANSSLNGTSGSDNSYANVTSSFNLCPKLDEVPVVEPLICKRISNERLTSLVFRKDCFIVATQDGFVNTWARPTKVIFFVGKVEFFFFSISILF
jgi:hypothetical protein